MKKLFLTFFIIATLFFISCSGNPEESCITSLDCKDGQMCLDGVCVDDKENSGDTDKTSDEHKDIEDNDENEDVVENEGEKRDDEDEVTDNENSDEDISDEDYYDEDISDEDYTDDDNSDDDNSDDDSIIEYGLKNIDGVLYHEGKIFYGIGVNYFDLFYRTLKDNDDTSYAQGLQKLSEAGIPFVRFNCGGYWPNEFDLYFNDEEKYFELLDAVVAAAEFYNIGLIPSFFWAYFTAPDINGESIDQLGNSASKTSDYIREYTAKIVQRYIDSPSIWAWEMGNEYSLQVDLPNAENYRPPIQPTLGTPESRTEADELSSQHMLAAYSTFAQTVRLYDDRRAILTGNAKPRKSAWNNTENSTWAQDTEEQFRSILQRDNPDPFDTVSIHAYPDDSDLYAGPSASIYELIYKTQKYSLEMKKPLTIGEFGANRDLGDPGQMNRVDEFFYAIEQNHVQLSAIWVYDFDNQEPEGWNITFENDRSEMLEKIVSINDIISLRDFSPDPFLKPEPLVVPENYFQAISQWFVGGTTANVQKIWMGPDSSLTVKGDYFGRMKITAPGSYWFCSPSITVSGEKASFGGYLRTNLQTVSIDIHFYNNETEVKVENLAISDISDWTFHNIKEKGGGKVVDVPAAANSARICGVVNSSDSSEEAPGYLDMDNFSGFELVP
ncbi:MAG: cellulase family glycosylhydrolase [bacterium]